MRSPRALTAAAVMLLALPYLATEAVASAAASPSEAAPVLVRTGSCGATGAEEPTLAAPDLPAFPWEPGGVGVVDIALASAFRVVSWIETATGELFGGGLTAEDAAVWSRGPDVSDPE